MNQELRDRLNLAKAAIQDVRKTPEAPLEDLAQALETLAGTADELLEEVSEEIEERGELTH